MVTPLVGVNAELAVYLKLSYGFCRIGREPACSTYPLNTETGAVRKIFETNSSFTEDSGGEFSVFIFVWVEDISDEQEDYV